MYTLYDRFYPDHQTCGLNHGLTISLTFIFPTLHEKVTRFGHRSRNGPVSVRQVLRDCLDWRCAFGVVLWYGQCEEAAVAEEADVHDVAGVFWVVKMVAEWLVKVNAS